MGDEVGLGHQGAFALGHDVDASTAVAVQDRYLGGHLGVERGQRLHRVDARVGEGPAL